MEGSKLILPGDPEFDFTLATAKPPNWQEVAWKSYGEFVHVFDAESGVMRTVNAQAATEYLEGGEYDERLKAIGELSEDEESDFADTTLFLPDFGEFVEFEKWG